MAVEIRLKRKYTIGGKAQMGYKRPADNGDSTRTRPNYHKMPDAWKKNNQQRKRIMVLMPNMKRRMINV